MSDLDAINKKIRESPNPFVEYIIQTCVQNWTQNAGSVPAPASNTTTTKAPPVVDEKKPKPKSSSSEDAPITDIFGGDDGW